MVLGTVTAMFLMTLPLASAQSVTITISIELLISLKLNTVSAKSISCPVGNDHGCVKHFPTHLINSPVSIADFRNDTAGAGKTLFHRVTTFRTNQ